MNQIGTDIRTYFEATTDPVTIEEIFDPGVVIVGPGGSRSERNDTMLTQERPAQTSPSRFRGPRIAAAAAIAALVVAVGLFAFSGGTDSQVVTTDPEVTVPPTTVPPTTVPPTTAPPTTQVSVTPSSPAELATASLDTLLEAFSNEDSEAVQSYFGESVVFTTYAGSDLVGPEAAAYWERVFGETGERLTDVYEIEQGTFAFVVRYLLPSGGSSTMVHEIEMAGETVERIEDRRASIDERLAEREVDRLFEAFNDQDVDALSAFFGDDVVYTGPSNVEFVGQQAATYWQRFLGETAMRTTGVFDLGDGTFGFDIDFIGADSGRATHRTALVEVVDRRITSFTED